MNLNDSMVSAIRDIIEKSEISSGPMKEDILDHLCCAVEGQMELGQPFDSAFSTSLKKFSPRGLNEIEKETFLLLHPKIMIMKKLMFGSGLILSIMIAIGLQLKMLHIAYAAELLIAGTIGFGVIFLPLLLKFSATRNAEKSSAERRKEWLAYISGYMLAAGGILKFIHVAPANETMILGTIILSFGFLPYFFLSQYQKPLSD